MTAEPCPSTHPEHGIACEIKRRNHPLCTGRGPDGFVDWPNEGYIAPRKGSKVKAVQELSSLASRVQRPVRAADGPQAPAEGFAAGLAGSESAGNRWDEDQKALVDDAIVIVAAKNPGGTFTSDAVWAQLAGSVPVTKGLTARLVAAEREGTIENTGETTISERGGEHDHGQRLTLWRSLA